MFVEFFLCEVFALNDSHGLVIEFQSLDSNLAGERCQFVSGILVTAENEFIQPRSRPLVARFDGGQDVAEQHEQKRHWHGGGEEQNSAAILFIKFWRSSSFFALSAASEKWGIA